MANNAPARVILMLLLAAGLPGACAADDGAAIPLIFDTDLGNDCDDVLALGMIHALCSRGECELLAVTITKDHPYAAPFADVVNTFYGRGDVPIGVCGSGVTPEEGKYNGLCESADADGPRYPHDLGSGREAPPAVEVLRRALAAAEDGSVVVCQVGFSTNLADLLESAPDQHSPLAGRELAARKVRLLSVMAGAFAKVPDGSTGQPREHYEYNVVMDIASAQKLCVNWPTPIVWSGFEVGLNLRYPHESIERDYRYADHHPLPEAYRLYNPPPHDRPTWDLTSVLYAVRPDRGYFRLSQSGRVSIADDGLTRFEPGGGRDRYLIVDEATRPRAIEAMVQLASQPPGG